MNEYDVIVVGGGLAGASLAKGLAEKGVRVLVLERTTTFRDRVRGEALSPWGVVEAKALGIYEPLLEAGGHLVRWLHSFGPERAGSVRDFVESTPNRSGFLDFYHPATQEVVLGLAEGAGADVRRGVVVIGAAGRGRHGTGAASVRVAEGRRTETVVARLVVGADGRNSRVRRWAGFSVAQDPQRLRIAGMLHEGLSIAEECAQAAWDASMGQRAVIFPIGKQRFRTYFMYYQHNRGRAMPTLSGAQDEGNFVRACRECGMPAEWFEKAEGAGPLATFEAADRWVEHPYRDGVALIGDAAAASDPSFGQGLALMLRDARVLRDRLLGQDDWEAAAHSYAEEHDQYYAALHRITGWQTDLFFALGPEAEARRARALPRHGEEPARGLDLHALGPETPSDERARRRFFGEE